MSFSKRLMVCAALSAVVCLPSAAQVRAGYLSTSGSTQMTNATRPGSPSARDRYRTTARVDTVEMQGDGYTPFMLSFVSPLQVPPRDFDVGGLRLSIIYGECVNFDGLDIGLVGRATGHGNGLFINGLLTLVEGSSVGLQIAPVNVVEGGFAGWQVGVANYAGTLPGADAKGWQIGVFNGATQFKGWQLGVINYTESMVGFQLGVVNIIANKDFAFMPIINAAF
jgi:hypothetical protein